jgi:hypothetical protein
MPVLELLSRFTFGLQPGLTFAQKPAAITCTPVIASPWLRGLLRLGRFLQFCAVATAIAIAGAVAMHRSGLLATASMPAESPRSCVVPASTSVQGEQLRSVKAETVTQGSTVLQASAAEVQPVLEGRMHLKDEVRVALSIQTELQGSVWHGAVCHSTSGIAQAQAVRKEPAVFHVVADPGRAPHALSKSCAPTCKQCASAASMTR